ncbi:4-(cytidine 5'-diphospho)-2-C-methyl-D-erythritol kinase [Ectothiorhodospiraceae bacterium BW-2]|nr:4-(cytidine 5'-diphospho)-2-C-methyl-D-erythritol kinase [Ectothiorhodospiraceae bacterium BW-2]
MSRSALAAAGYWPAPAKINHFLHITGRRADGYHLLQTVFQFLDFGDQLAFEINQTGQIGLTSSLLGVADEDNLVLRAAKRLHSHCRCRYGVTIDLRKQIPAGAGLGGGSSDAATTLVALNRLWRCSLSVDELAELGLTLGADVPVFVRGEAAWAEGIGERLQPITLLEPWFLVVVPPVSIATAELFCHQQLTRDQSAITICAFLTGSENTINVFQPLVSRLYPEVNRVIQWLDQFQTPRMSGTGSAVFAPFASRAQALEVAATCPDSSWKSFVARGINSSPLKQRLLLE